MERLNLLDLKSNLIQRWGKAFGRGFPLRSWQEGFLEGEKDHSNTIGPFKRFSKEIFPSEKHLVLSPNKKGKPPRPKTKSWVNSNETLVIKENILRGRVLQNFF